MAKAVKFFFHTEKIFKSFCRVETFLGISERRTNFTGLLYTEDILKVSVRRWYSKDHSQSERASTDFLEGRRHFTAFFFLFFLVCRIVISIELLLNRPTLIYTNYVLYKHFETLPYREISSRSAPQKIPFQGLLRREVMEKIFISERPPTDSS